MRERASTKLRSTTDANAVGRQPTKAHTAVSASQSTSSRSSTRTSQRGGTRPAVCAPNATRRMPSVWTFVLVLHLVAFAGGDVTAVVSAPTEDGCWRVRNAVIEAMGKTRDGRLNLNGSVSPCRPPQEP